MRIAQPLPYVVLAVLMFAPPASFTADQPSTANVTTQYEIVPCLLASRVRRIGNLVYPERRRLVETSALECKLKGGEYTHYDRASPENSVVFFKTLAEQGDTQAQVSLGDVYQYLFEEPRYNEAARWYQLAAEEGNKSGMMRLAELYEQGNGVDKNELMATNLWREATGAGEELVLASELEEARTAADERIAGLTDRLRNANEQTEETRRQLNLARVEFDERQNAFLLAEEQLRVNEQRFAQLAASQTNSRELSKLRTRLSEQRGTIDDQRFEIESLQTNLNEQEAKLTASFRRVELSNDRLNEELAAVSTKADRELESAVAELQAKDVEFGSINSELAIARRNLTNTDTAYRTLLTKLEKAGGEAESNRRAARQLKKLQGERAEQLDLLNDQQQKIVTLEQRLARTEAEKNQLRNDLDHQVHQKQEVEARLAQTEAEINANRQEAASLTRQLESASKTAAALQLERGDINRQLAAASADSDETARLTAALQAKNTELSERENTIKGLEADVGRFRAELEEIQAERSKLFATRSPAVPDRLPDTSDIKLPRGVKLGTSYALIVGNNNYQHLSNLRNAHNDAKAVHALLGDEYSFDSELLLDATRLDIYRAVHGKLEQLEPEDSLLIYYAGHGYEAKNVSYWLPVETERDPDLYDEQAISSSKINSWLKAMRAKHVMIIADSYAATGVRRICDEH
ncbi:MAG: caspase family protein, partial [Gammaproteobacteria bacterium]|nr:caspase family protein [Gammaproteobacteria bacterium]